MARRRRRANSSVGAERSPWPSSSATSSSLLPLALYYGIMNGSRRGQTVGKMALGIAVRDARTGQRIGFLAAALGR